MRSALLTGAGGFLGGHVERALLAAGWRVFSSRAQGPDRIEFALERPDETAMLVTRLRPAVVIHAAAESAVGAAESDPERADLVNRSATAALAKATAATGARFLFFSTDQVLDGRNPPYSDDAEPNPLHVYGRTKARAEAAVTDTGGDYAILRVALAFGHSPSGRRSASEMLTAAAADGRTVGLFTDEIRSPVDATWLGHAVARLAAASATGTFNAGGPVALSRFAFGERVARAFALPESTFRAVRAADLDLDPPRPRDLSLDSTQLYRTIDLPHPPLEECLQALARTAR